jgi:ribonuclease HI
MSCHGLVLVTCYTDASFSRLTGGQSRGRWAVWLRSDEGRLVRSGKCPDYVVTSTNAELSAILAAVHLGVTSWAGARVLLVRSDCLAALALADGSGRARDLAAQRMQKRIHSMVERSGVELRCRWVKAHQDSSTSREAYLNNACDRLARSGRKRRR